MHCFHFILASLDKPVLKIFFEYLHDVFNFNFYFGSNPILINEDIEFIYKFLILLKTFSFIVEKEDFDLFNIVPLTKEFFSESNKLYSCVTKKRMEANYQYSRFINEIEIDE